jgi:predicted transglutaminase-like cysteine proteinase
MRKPFNVIAFAGLILTVPIIMLPATIPPFGIHTVAAPPGSLSTIWRGLRLDMLSDDAMVLACRGDPDCGSPAALRFIALVDEAMRYDGRARVGHINRAINADIAATRHDVSWLSPLAAMAVPGDCKSYAVTKYAALGDAGIALVDRKLVVIYDRAHPKETHLIVVVRIDGQGQWFILDNETLFLVDSTSKPTYEPLHTLDENGVWDFPAISATS